MGFCYLTFTGRPLSLQLLSRKPVAKIWGETEKGTVTVAVQGGHGTFYKDAGQRREGGVEWEGGEKGQVQWVSCPPLPISFSVFLPVTSHHWEEMGSFSFKCLPKKKDRGLSSHSVINQKKDEAASRLGIRWLAFFFPLHLSLSGSRDTRPTAAADFPQPAACCRWAWFSGSPAGCPHAGFFPAQWQLLI